MSRVRLRVYRFRILELLGFLGSMGLAGVLRLSGVV